MGRFTIQAGIIAINNATNPRIILKYDSMNRFTIQAGITAINNTINLHHKDESFDANRF
jgi:hypothetical protein